MLRFLALAILATLGPLSSAEVIRCADAAGNVSYTDASCPAGAKPVGRVLVPEAGDRPGRPPNVDASARGSAAPRGSTEAAAPPAQAPAGPAIIDSRGGGSSNSNAPGADARRSDRGDDAVVIDYGYPDTGTYRQPRQRDMRPRIRNCDATGCEDRQGNHYNRSGQLDRYQGIDGKTCRPVGTTTICR